MSNRIRKTRPQTVCVRKHGRASVSASVTIEAALAVPVFFFALVCLIYLLELMAIGTAVRSGLQYAGKQAARRLMPRRFFSRPAWKRMWWKVSGRTGWSVVL